LIKEAGLHERILGRVAVSENDESAVGYWKNLNALSSAIPFRKSSFAKGVYLFQVLSATCRNLSPAISIKFHASGSSSIVGSDSKNHIR
jgi:hypothetical protein